MGSLLLDSIQHDIGTQYGDHTYINMCYKGLAVGRASLTWVCYYLFVRSILLRGPTVERPGRQIKYKVMIIIYTKRSNLALRTRLHTLRTAVPQVPLRTNTALVPPARHRNSDLRTHRPNITIGVSHVPYKRITSSYIFETRPFLILPT